MKTLAIARFINVGHRGAAAYAPENTIASFEEAITRKADMIEFDLRRTIDGSVVAFHDRYIKLSNGRKKAVSKVRIGELGRAIAHIGADLALFEEILIKFGRRIPLNIEIKIGGIEREVLFLLKKYPPAFEPTISSFYPWILKRYKRLDRNLKIALILGQEKIRKINFLARPMVDKLVSGLGIKAIHLQETIVSRAVVDTLTRLGVSILVWTVDDPEKMRKLVKLGVDGIITNKPDILYKICSEMSLHEKPILHRVNGNMGRFAYTR